MAEGPEQFLEKAWRLMDKGEYSAAVAAFTDFIEEGDEKTLDKRIHSEVLRGRAWGRVRCSEFDNARKDYERALALSTEDKDQLGMADALRGIGHILWQTGDHMAAMDRLIKALEVAKRVNERALLGRIYTDIGNVHNSRGEFQASVDSYKGATALLEAIGDKRESSRAYNNLGDVLIRMERFGDAKEALQRSIVLGKELGNESAVAWARSTMAECLIRLGEAGKAVVELEMALSEFERVSDMDGVCHIYRVYGLYYTLQKDWNLAAQALKRSLTIAEKFGIREMRAFANQAMGLMLTNKGEGEAAREHLEKALEEFMDLHMAADAEATRNILKKSMWA